MVFPILCPSSLPEETGEDPRYSLGTGLEVGPNKGKKLAGWEGWEGVGYGVPIPGCAAYIVSEAQGLIIRHAFSTMAKSGS